MHGYKPFDHSLSAGVITSPLFEFYIFGKRIEYHEATEQEKSQHSKCKYNQTSSNTQKLSFLISNFGDRVYELYLPRMNLIFTFCHALFHVPIIFSATRVECYIFEAIQNYHIKLDSASNNLSVFLTNCMIQGNSFDLKMNQFIRK